MSGLRVLEDAFLEPSAVDVHFELGQSLDAAHPVFKHELDALLAHIIAQCQFGFFSPMSSSLASAT